MGFCCGNFWISYRDPVAYLAMPFACVQIVYVIYCMSTSLVFPILGIGIKSATVLISFYSLLILVIWSYFQAIFTEPGIVNSEFVKRIEEHDKDASNYRRCERCDCIKPIRAHHCRRCQKCILKMDHHCPWISNCVGARNQKPFMLFLFYVILAEAFALVMTTLYCINNKKKFQRYLHFIPMEYLFSFLLKWPKTLQFLHKWHLNFPLFEDQLKPQVFVCVQALFSIVFFIFCLILLYDQLRNIWYDRTFIEESNGQVDLMHMTFYESFVETMGDPFGIRWFIPLPGMNIDGVINSLCTEVIEMEMDDHEKTDYRCLLEYTDKTLI